KTAFSAATMMSQASAVSNPPPIATPLTAAIRGLSRSNRWLIPANPVAGRGPRRPAAWTFKSLPAENARFPAPVMMPTHRSGRAAGRYREGGPEARGPLGLLGGLLLRQGDRDLVELGGVLEDQLVERRLAERRLAGGMAHRLGMRPRAVETGKVAGPQEVLVAD